MTAPPMRFPARRLRDVARGPAGDATPAAAALAAVPVVTVPVGTMWMSMAAARPGDRSLWPGEPVLIAGAAAPSPARELLDRAAGAGQAVRQAGDLPTPRTAVLTAVAAPARAAGHGIVQESQTDAVRHSGAAVVMVGLRCLPGEVRALVEDGLGAGDPGGAAVARNGLRGVRARGRRAAGSRSQALGLRAGSGGGAAAPGGHRWPGE